MVATPTEYVAAAFSKCTSGVHYGVLPHEIVGEDFPGQMANGIGEVFLRPNDLASEGFLLPNEIDKWCWRSFYFVKYN